MVSSPSYPYDVGEMRSESRPHALNASRASTSSPRRGEHCLRAFQTLISHADAERIVALNRDGVVAFISLRRRGDEIRVTTARSFQTLVSHPDGLRTVALNRDGVVANPSLRRRGDEIRVTAARSRRVPSINVLSAAGRALLSRAFQTLISHHDVERIVARNRDGVIVITSLRRRGDEIRVTAARSQCVPSINFFSAAGRALSPHLPDTVFAR